LERQPYITEVATYSQVTGTPPAEVTEIMARAVEIFNPYATDIDATTDQYYLFEVGSGTGRPRPISLPGLLYPNSGVPLRPFTTFVTGDPASVGKLVDPNPPYGDTPRYLSAPEDLKFENGWTLYLVRRYTYPGDVTETDIVVDQFEVKGANIGKEGVGAPEGAFSVQRVVKVDSPWTATVPKTSELPMLDPPTSMGNWNDASAPGLHPVEVNFANTGSFTRPTMNPTPLNDPRAFPTTGSLLMLMRHANRPLQDYAPPGGNPVTQLAFTSRLLSQSTVTDATGGTIVTIFEEDRIDNGRMPIFDEPELGADNNWYSAHHLAPFVTQQDAPGNLDMLCWGQLVFDYFTALPLSNPGPYVDVEPGPAVVVALPASKPRVDLDGLRVHGRININAAPWKVLTGLPFVPMQRIPGVALRDKIATLLGIAPTAYEEAIPIGPELAQAIVAYRELRPLPSPAVNLTGNYADGTPTVNPTPPGAPIAFGRGWEHATPLVRRGTGFMSVGELANVRHYGAADALHRFDLGVINTNARDNNTENFVDAAAALVALGDWVTVRSQVFTVYGVLRGEDDPAIVDPDPLVQQKLRTQDADSRALRFQETIDRLPTFLGEPMPSRIGDRTLTRYADDRND